MSMKQIQKLNLVKIKSWQQNVINSDPIVRFNNFVNNFVNTQRGKILNVK